MRRLFQYMEHFSVIYEAMEYCIFKVCKMFKLQVTKSLFCLIRVTDELKGHD